MRRSPFSLFLAVSLLLGLSGCALTPKQAAELTPVDLCHQYYFGNSNGVLGEKNAATIYREVRSRGNDYCDRYKDVVVAREQARRDADAALLGALLGASALVNSTQPQAPAVAPAQRPTPMSCRVIKNPFGDRVDCF